MTISADEAKALLDAATPGPWKARFDARLDSLHVDGGENSYDDVLERQVDCGRYCQGGTAVINATKPDAALIAAAPDLAATVVELSDERDALRAAIDKVLALHKPSRLLGHYVGDDGAPEPFYECGECGLDYPCKTVVALTQGGEQ